MINEITNTRVLWQGQVKSQVAGTVPCRVVLGTRQKRKKEKDPWEDFPEVVYEAAFEKDAMGCPRYTTQPLQDIPVEFYLVMEVFSEEPR
jgi:hypothetical protein